MASLKRTMLIFAITSWFHLSVGSKVYNVGDSNGWDANNIDYKSWASSKTFHPGDSIVFEYDAQIHNVMQVRRSDYESCNPTMVPIATYTTGKDTINLKKKGNLFFVCGSPGHCETGQKVHIKVVPSSSSMNSAPAVSPSSSSSPPPSSLSSPPSSSTSPSSSASTIVLPSPPPSSSAAMAVVPSKALLPIMFMALVPVFLGLSGHH